MKFLCVVLGGGASQQMEEVAPKVIPFRNIIPFV
jgi:hypothetical protein